MWQTPQWLAPDPPFGPDRKRAPVGGGSRVGCAGVGPRFGVDVRKTCRCIILRGGPRWANSQHSALRPKGAASPCQEQDPTSTMSTGWGRGPRQCPAPHTQERGGHVTCSPCCLPLHLARSASPFRRRNPTREVGDTRCADAHAGMRDGGAASSAEPDQEAGSPGRPGVLPPRPPVRH